MSDATSGIGATEMPSAAGEKVSIILEEWNGSSKERKPAAHSDNAVNIDRKRGYSQKVPARSCPRTRRAARFHKWKEQLEKRGAGAFPGKKGGKARWKNRLTKTN